MNNTLFIDFYHEEVKYIFDNTLDVNPAISEKIINAKRKIEEAISWNDILTARKESYNLLASLSEDGLFDDDKMKKNIKIKTLYNALKNLVTL